MTRREIKEQKRLLFKRLTDAIYEQGYFHNEISDAISREVEQMNYRRYRTIRSDKPPHVTPKQDEIDALYKLFSAEIEANERKIEITEIEPGNIDDVMNRIEDIEKLIVDTRGSLKDAIDAKLIAENEALKEQIEQMKKKRNK